MPAHKRDPSRECQLKCFVSNVGLLAAVWASLCAKEPPMSIVEALVEHLHRFNNTAVEDVVHDRGPRNTTMPSRLAVECSRNITVAWRLDCLLPPILHQHQCFRKLRVLDNPTDDGVLVSSVPMEPLVASIGVGEVSHVNEQSHIMNSHIA